MANFEKDLKKLAEYGTTLDKMHTTSYNKDIEELKSRLNDPAILGAIDEHIGSIEEKLKDETARKELARTTIDKWRKEGYVITKLEGIMDSDITHIENTVKEYQKNVDR